MTPWRWAKYGIKARDGAVVKLEYAKIGGRLITSVEALQRFSERLLADSPSTDAAADGEAVVPSGTGSPRTPNKRRRDSEKAAVDLEKLGVK
jgi:hypothetical protein